MDKFKEIAKELENEYEQFILVVTDEEKNPDARLNLKADMNTIIETILALVETALDDKDECETINALFLELLQNEMALIAMGVRK